MICWTKTNGWALTGQKTGLSYSKQTKISFKLDTKTKANKDQ